jgi:hypothetical protein
LIATSTALTHYTRGFVSSNCSTSSARQLVFWSTWTVCRATDNGRRSADETRTLVRMHVLPSIDGRRLASITTAEVNAFILKRQKDVMLIGGGDEREQRRCRTAKSAANWRR